MICLEFTLKESQNLRPVRRKFGGQVSLTATGGASVPASRHHANRSRAAQACQEPPPTNEAMPIMPLSLQNKNRNLRFLPDAAREKPRPDFSK
jgi:hypothetical protein